MNSYELHMARYHVIILIAPKQSSLSNYTFNFQALTFPRQGSSSKTNYITLRLIKFRVLEEKNSNSYKKPVTWRKQASVGHSFEQYVGGE